MPITHKTIIIICHRWEKNINISIYNYLTIIGGYKRIYYVTLVLKQKIEKINKKQITAGFLYYVNDTFYVTYNFYIYIYLHHYLLHHNHIILLAINIKSQKTNKKNPCL